MLKGLRYKLVGKEQYRILLPELPELSVGYAVSSVIEELVLRKPIPSWEQSLSVAYAVEALSGRPVDSR